MLKTYRYPKYEYRRPPELDGARFDQALSAPTFNAAVDAARISSAQSGETPVKDLRVIRQTIGSQALLAFFDAPFAPLFLLLVFMLHWVLGVAAGVVAYGVGLVSLRALTPTERKVLAGILPTRLKRG